MFLVRDSKRNVFGKGGKVSRIYVKKIRHLMFLVMKIAKLQREREVGGACIGEFFIPG